MGDNVLQLHTPSKDAEAGLKLLNKRQRTLHPRGQVQCLRRMAVIAQGKAERTREHAGQFGGDYAADIAEAVAYERKVRIALEACLYLNRAHGLGYPVP